MYLPPLPGAGPEAVPASLDVSRALDHHRTMTLIRVFEERLLELRSDGEIVGPVHPYVGEEAVAVGTCSVLEERDSIVSNYRGHGHAIARGVGLEPLLAELFGKASGLCGGKAAALVSSRAHNLLLSSGIIGAGVPVAAGAALASQVRGDSSVAVAFIGDGSLGAGQVHEALNLASVQRLPLVVVCEHNGYQGGIRTEEVFPSRSLLAIPRAHGIDSSEVDGCDVLAVTDALRHAVHRARDGGGPSFVQAWTYLARFHLQFDAPPREERPAAEKAAWDANDPIATLESRLRAAGVDDAPLRTAWDDAGRRVEDAVRHARDAPWPDADQVTTHVFGGTR
ncbi:thiamine pyrophosphate-dependent dehydrogenase E1 component subunit alpha [Cellulosimicrobium marinum]|uniref:thiamine pyrophosphate-dependent dehydrogenase E1 component subunit alpha n=1 Tax=Cellulosimicrobium marinum TaxID=1638992 RepID=UPI001E28AA15|nr:thiamine pyrophosphate-dependent dehydrogenase E1 component subunit alpha [Cellulosimicrobium marinum]MCB7135715.1 thiamine pyrophosphate-dependent dehydrogenase E1 component subunit alpha [Cellulosimicrobium marinum]